MKLNEQLEILISTRLNKSQSETNLKQDLSTLQNRLNDLVVKLNTNDAQNQLKTLADLANNIFAGKNSSGQVWVENLGGTLKNAILTVQNQAKQGLISLDELQQKLFAIQQVYGQLGAFNGNNGASNENAMLNALSSASKQYEQSIQNQIKMQSDLEKQAEEEYQAYLKEQETLDKAHYQALVQDAKMSAQEKNQVDKDYVQWWSQSLKEIETLDKAHYLALEEDQKRSLAQQKAAQDAYAAQLQAESNRGTIRSAMNSNSGGLSMLGMVASLGVYQTLSSAYNQMVQGMKDVESGSAGLNQVFEGQIKSQDQLNSVTNDFIGIAQRYGQSVNEVLDGAKLWGKYCLLPMSVMI